MKIIIPGKPIPKKRPRYSSRGGKVQLWNPQHKIAAEIKKRFLLEVLDDNNLNEISKNKFYKNNKYIVFIEFYFKPPKMSKKKLSEFVISSHAIKPDIDNLAKFYLDCANGILWDDDCSVVSLHCEKMWDLVPRTEIIIEIAKEPPLYE